jgi:hypothetical protein
MSTRLLGNPIKGQPIVRRESPGLAGQSMSSFSVNSHPSVSIGVRDEQCMESPRAESLIPSTVRQPVGEKSGEREQTAIDNDALHHAN